MTFIPTKKLGLFPPHGLARLRLIDQRARTPESINSFAT